MGIRLDEMRLDGATNEILLWHGLHPDDVVHVAHNGLDDRFSDLKNFYGAGSYFTDQWCKALQYSRAAGCSIRKKRCRNKFRCACPGPKVALLCRVLLGEPYMAKQSDNLKGQRHPPFRDAENQILYDSVIVEPQWMQCTQKQQQHREFVLFDRRSIYPEHIVYFTCK
eukprot:NODE_4695_length_649_cov_254.752525.p1 GENE.NODE_4695_length_649_cov_254.752525~~NODE_4695_length_649_cov_254.752525.p1  ORF type:complete len:168 (+),score=55.49 NODE_4695_length_649_cov_254.752525:3-506(+)